MRMSARTTAGVCPNKGCFGKLLIHFVKLPLYFVQFQSTVLEAAASHLASIHCLRMSARTTAGGMSEQGVFWEAPYPLRGLARPLRSTLYSLFLKPLLRSGLQFIASLMRRKFRKKLAPLLFFMSEHKSFCAECKKLLGSIIGAP